MSAEKKIDAVQTQLQTPSLQDLNPLNSNDPLMQTIAKGELPSNAVLNDAIDKARSGIQTGRTERELNVHGETLAKDASDILETAQRFLNEKNQGENIQHLIHHASQASGATGREATNALSSVSNMLSHTLGLDNLLRKDAYVAQKDAETAYGYVRELFLYTVQSKEFRLFLIDFINFFQSTLTNVTEKVNELGDAMKTDVAHNDTNMSATSSTANVVTEQAKLDARSNVAQWNEQTKREYYQRFQTLLNRVSSKPEYKRLIGLYFKWMDDLKVRASQVAEVAKDKAAEAANQVQTSANRVASNSTWDALWNDIRGVVDGFVGAGAFDTLYAETWDLYLTALNDKQANDYLDSLKLFINDAINDPKSLDVEAKKKEGEELLYRGRQIFEGPKYAKKINTMSRSSQEYLNKLTNDALSNELSDKFKKFMEDFALDSQGRPDLYVMSDSLSQLKNLVYPLLQKQLSEVTVARIVGSNESLDWAIENVLVSIPDMMPELFTIRTKNLISINLKQLETEKNNTKVTLEVKNIRPVFKNMKFWYQRKTFPKIEDYGVADIDLSKGTGARIKINWKVKSKNNRPFAFSLMEVRCVIDSLEVDIKEAKHSVFDRLATSLFAATIKQQVAAAIVNSIVDALSPLNDQMNEWFATRPAATLYSRANQSIQYAYNSANQAIKDHPLEKAAELASDLKDRVVDATHYVTDNAAAAVNNLTTQAESTVQAVKEVVQEKAADAKEYVNKEMPEVSKAVADLKLDAEKAVNKAEQGAADAAEKAKVGVEDAWDHHWESKSGRRHKRKSHKKAKQAELVPISDPNEFPALAK